MSTKIQRSTALTFPTGVKFLDKYTIETSDPAKLNETAVPLGEGGSGIVFLASQQLTEAVSVKRAIKFFMYRDDIAEMTHHANSGGVSESQFNDEIVNLSSFNHENILKVTEAGIYATTGLKIPFVVTPFIDGPTLKKVIDEAKVLSILNDDYTGIVELALQLCRGVRHLHSQGFFHCDLAPKNIFLQGAYPDLQLVIGDLGIGRSNNAASTAPIFVIGSKDYCPASVRELMHKEVPAEDFFKLQPQWDLYALAKTILELVAAAPSPVVRRPWLSALRKRCVEITTNPTAYSAKEIERHIEWLRPVQNTMAGVQELAESYPSNRRTLLPVEQVTTSRRVRKIIGHPALLRLNKVPQLVMATAVFPGATHTRYEHSLGTYQVVRRYLLQLLDNDEFLAHFSPEHIELSLVCALLSSAKTFPFYTIISEIRIWDPHVFAGFSGSAVLTRLLESAEFADRDGRTLAAAIQHHFPLVSIDDVRRLLLGSAHSESSVAERLIRNLLNGSIDARVLDYLRRDSLHLGLSTGHDFDLSELMPHLDFKAGRIMLRSSGLSVVEQIISLRYWLFNRIYWNSPNRSLIAMLRHVFLSLSKVNGFADELFARVLNASEAEILTFVSTHATKANDARTIDVCDLLQSAKPRRYDDVYQCNRAGDDALDRQICDRLSYLSLEEWTRFQEELNTAIVKAYQLTPDRQHVLVDYPIERGPMKLGDDMNISGPNGIVPLDRVSGICRGVQQSFAEQLQRVRIFIHPDTNDALDEGQQTQLRKLVRSALEAIV